jgi:hypothetical protein
MKVRISSEEGEEMARFRRVRWIAITVLTVTAAATFAVGAEAYGDQGHDPCKPVAHSAQANGDHSWRTGGFRSAGCKAWRHLHRHSLMARTR